MIQIKMRHLSILLAFGVMTSCNAPLKTQQEAQTKTEIVVVDNSTEQETPQSPEAQVLPLDPSVVQGTLPNGMKYFIRKNTKPENRMEMRLAVDAGSIQEDDDQKGLAHFLEHMAFNGSQNFKENDLIHYVEGIGVQFGPHLNAYTSFDETVYMLQVPTDQKEIIDTALLIMEDWANGLTLPMEEIKKERGVVLSEWRNSLGPQQRMQNEFFPVLFKDSRYPDRLPIGDTAIIANANQELLGRFYQDWYRPDLMAIILVGDFDPKEMEQEIINRFSSIPTVENPREKKVYPIPSHDETLVKIVTDQEAPYTQVILFEKHEAKENNTVIGYRDYIKQQIINGILNERFKEILQQPAPPFFMAISNYGKQLRNLDAFANLAIGTSDNVENILKVLYEEQFRAERHGFTQGEYDRAIAQIKSTYETALREKDKTESVHYATELVEYYLSGETAPGIEIEHQLLTILEPTITLAEINQDIKNLITHKNTVVVITAPEKDKDILPTEKRILEIKEEVAQSEIAAIEEVEVATELLAELPTAGKITSITQEENNIEKWQLSNGATVWVKPTDFQNDEIIIEAFSQGGSSLYEDADFYTISNTAPLINESGYGDFDALSLSRALAGKKVSSTPFITALEEGISAKSTPKDIETLMQLIHLNFTAPVKDQNAFDSYINKNKSLYTNLLANPQVYFQKTIFETLYSNNVRRSFPKVEDFDQVDLDKAVQFYTERFNNAADFQFVIVGNTEDVELQSLVEQYIASLPSTGQTEQWKDNQINIVKGKINKEVQMGSAPKTNVLFTYSGDDKWTRDSEIEFQMMSQVLDIKLRESLREDQGGVYGVGVQSQYQRVPSSEFFTIITYNVDPENATSIEQEAMKVIASVKQEGVDAGTLSKVKEKAKRQREIALKENAYWVSTIRKSARFNEPIENSDAYIKKVQSITNEQIIQAAQKYLDEKNFIRIVMSPTEK